MYMEQEAAQGEAGRRGLRASGRGITWSYLGSCKWTSENAQKAKFAAKLVAPLRAGRSVLVLRRPPYRTEVHAYSTSGAVSNPLWNIWGLFGVEKTLARKGASAHERASSKGSEQKHPRVGARALLQQRDYVGGPRLLRRGGHLLRAQGQGQRHRALHLRAARRPEDSGGRRGARKLNAVASYFLRPP